MPTRTVSISNRHPRLRLDRRRLASAIGVLDAHAVDFLGGCPPGELSIAFVTDPELALLHDEFLDDPSPTDVITFSGDPAFGLAGEICISADAARRQTTVSPAKKAGRAPQAPKPSPAATLSQELLLYVVHGWLHLAGYDDLQPAKKRQMRSAEQRALHLLATAKIDPRFRALQGRDRPLARPRGRPSGSSLPRG